MPTRMETGPISESLRALAERITAQAAVFENTQPLPQGCAAPFERTAGYLSVFRKRLAA